MANTAREFVNEARAAGHEALLTNCVEEICAGVDEVVIHGAWLRALHRAARRAKVCGARLVVRPAGSYDPVRLNFHAWKKRLVAPWEHAMLRRADVLLATCRAEVEWLRAYQPHAKIELTNLRRFFRIEPAHEPLPPLHTPLRIMYLGRRHPLKGIPFLEEAVRNLPVELKVVSGTTGAAKEELWRWADVLCLPTLSENFGRVVAEALERNKRVITTDGAPAWAPDEFTDARLTYIAPFCAASAAQRIASLRTAISNLITTTTKDKE